MLDYYYVSWSDLIAHIRDIRHYLINENHTLPDTAKDYTFSRIRRMYDEVTVIDGNQFTVVLKCNCI